MRHIPFRVMRNDARKCMALCGLLLSLPAFQWPATEYARYTIQLQMWKSVENPTYPQMVSVVLLWLRFAKRLIDALPDDFDSKKQAIIEYDKWNELYKDLEPKDKKS